MRGLNSNMLGCFRHILSACLILTACQLATPLAAGQAVKISQFSGKPVPRFESLRYSRVNGRTGPSTDHQVAWEYERAGLPVLVIKETRDWAQIRDPNGDEVWVAARMLTDPGHVIVTRETVLRRRAQSGSPGRATLQAGVLAELESCEERWCEVRVGDFRGWVDKPSLWGLNTDSAGL